MKHFLLIVGARPNFMKMAPLHAALKQRGASLYLVHTGQHYDVSMSDVFFKELGLPAPDVNLGIGSADRLTQTKKIIDGLLPIFAEKRFDAIVVVGDVTSTAAATMAGVVAGVPVVHVEAGLRSFNWRMPEELNRMIADHHASALFVTEPTALRHLEAERIPKERIHFVGNVMIDALRQIESLADRSDVLDRLHVQPRAYGVLTLHRPENVDNEERLRRLWEGIRAVASRLPLIFPVHPRTKQRLIDAGFTSEQNISFVEPLGYIDNIALLKQARVVLTDSGGLQEETTVLGIPCFTLREETERPVTVDVGTSELVGTDVEKMRDAIERVLANRWKAGRIPDLWDGQTAHRIAEILINL